MNSYFYMNVMVYACMYTDTHTHTHTRRGFHTEVSCHVSFNLSLTSNPGRFEGFHSFCWPVLKLLGSNSQFHSHNSKITVGYFLPTLNQTLCSVRYISVLSAQYFYLMTLPSAGILSHSVVTPWTVAHQPPLSTGIPRQECWTGLPFPSSGNLPNPGIEPASPVVSCIASGFLILLSGTL